LSLLSGAHAGQAWRHRLAQINQPYAETVEETAIKLEYDLYYIEHANILMDITILLRTFGAVLGFKGR